MIMKAQCHVFVSYQCVEGCNFSLCGDPMTHINMNLSQHASPNSVIPMNDTSVDASLFVTHVGEDYRCIVCNGVPLSPADIPSCAHVGCITCLTKSIQQSSKCPSCSQAADVANLRVNKHHH
jgi:hypothetical protein